MFAQAVIRQRVKLAVAEVGSNVRDIIENRGIAMMEGVCTVYGYVRPGTMQLVEVSPGRLSYIDMGRHYTFECKFRADVCNPLPGSKFRAHVRSMNQFGILAEAGYWDDHGKLVPVIEVVIVRDPSLSRNLVDIDSLAIGDDVGVELLSQRFELRDTRVTAHGRTVPLEEVTKPDERQELAPLDPPDMEDVLPDAFDSFDPDIAEAPESESGDDAEEPEPLDAETDADDAIAGGGADEYEDDDSAHRA
jgi:hypothetical protein